MHYTFDDFLIEPGFSDISSRSEVDLSVDKFFCKMDLPVFSANMQCITGSAMATKMDMHGGMGVLHRFSTIDENCQMFLRSPYKTAVSVGIGEAEKTRAQRLLEVGAMILFLDVAHGAQKQVAKAYSDYKKMGYSFIVVGNFASGNSYLDFLNNIDVLPDAIKIGVGPGAACSTRIKTGVGVPQMSAIMSLRSKDKRVPIIADGGIKSPGDIAKALAAGADAVMIGGMLAGTDACEEASVYSGSASKKSYESQGKTASYRSAEGEDFSITPKGYTSDVLSDIEGGLRSAFSYVGAKNLKEFKEKAKLIQISRAAANEGRPHFGK